MLLTVDNLRSFPIGRKEDGGVETVVFDCTAWRTAYPFLTDYRLEVTAPNGLVYMPVITEQGNNLIWDIKQSAKRIWCSGSVAVNYVYGK